MLFYIPGWDRIFITTPRLFNGNPATLAWVPRGRAGVQYDTHKSPLLQVNRDVICYYYADIVFNKFCSLVKESANVTKM